MASPNIIMSCRFWSLRPLRRDTCWEERCRLSGCPGIRRPRTSFPAFRQWFLLPPGLLERGGKGFDEYQFKVSRTKRDGRMMALIPERKADFSRDYSRTNGLAKLRVCSKEILSDHRRPRKQAKLGHLFG